MILVLSNIINSYFYSNKEIPAKNPESASVGTASIPSITADDKDNGTDKPKSNTGSVLGSNDSLLDDKI